MLRLLYFNYRLQHISLKLPVTTQTQNIINKARRP